MNLLSLLSLVLLPASALGYTYETAPLPSADHSFFGSGLELSGNGNILAIASWYLRETANEWVPGSVISKYHPYIHVFEKQTDSWTEVWGTWFMEEFDALPGDAEDSFSVSVSTDGSIVAVGLPYSDSSRVVRVYERVTDTSVWSKKGSDLFGGNSGLHDFGATVSLNGSGDLLVVAEPEFFSGLIYTYQWDSGCDCWSDTIASLSTSNMDGSFGIDLSLSSDGLLLAVADLGLVNGYKLDAQSNTWTQHGSSIQLAGGGSTNPPRVALNGNGKWLVIGDAAAHQNAGTVEVYRRNKGEWNPRTQTQGSVLQGKSVAISASNGSQVVAGAGSGTTGSNDSRPGVGTVSSSTSNAHLFSRISGSYNYDTAGVSIYDRSLHAVGDRVSIPNDGTTIASSNPSSSEVVLAYA